MDIGSGNCLLHRVVHSIWSLNMLKRIGTYARQDLENMLGTKVNLKTWVKVKKDWLDNDSIISKSKLK